MLTAGGNVHTVEMYFRVRVDESRIGIRTRQTSAQIKPVVEHAAVARLVREKARRVITAVRFLLHATAGELGVLAHYGFGYDIGEIRLVAQAHVMFDHRRLATGIHHIAVA